MIFELTTFNIVLMLLTAVATLCVCWQSVSRSGFKSKTILMELFRFCLVCLTAFTLFQPTVVVPSAPTGTSVVRVLVDRSTSMTTEDVVSAQDGTITSRQQATEKLSEETVWLDAESTHSVEVDSFASVSEANQELSESATDIHRVLNQVASNPGNTTAIVLASDGDWNIGESPATAARRLRQLGIPVYTIGVGNPTSLPDLAVSNFDLPTFAVVGKPLRIPFSITSTLDSAVDLDVAVSLPDGQTRTVAVQVPAAGSTDSVISWRPTKIGDNEISISVPEHPEERVVTNNKQSVPISIRYESLQVLIIDSFPRWEYRYTRNALVRDPGVNVHTLLLHPDFEGNGGGPGYLNEFPSTEELGKYDVVFLGDVGLGKNQLTQENCDELVKVVRNQATGLIFLPGFRGLQSTLAGHKIEELMPVEIDWNQSRGVRSTTAASFNLTDSGRESLLTRLETSWEANEKIWSALPGFFWHAAVTRARPNTNVLAVHDAKTNRFGRLPLIVTRTYGTGKALFVGSDSAWRWRKGVEDLYHYRFWSQMVRWMAYQRNMASGDSMRLIFTPDRPRAGDTVNVLVNAMDKNGEPLRSGNVTTQVVTPTGTVKTLNLASDEESWGLFRGAFVADEGGTFNLTTRCRQTSAELVTELNVRGVPREKVGQPARFGVMQEIALITGGRAINIKNQGDLDEMVNTICDLPPPKPVNQYYQVWSHPLWGLFLVGMLGCFWGIRKYQGLI